MGGRGVGSSKDKFYNNIYSSSSIYKGRVIDYKGGWV